MHLIHTDTDKQILQCALDAGFDWHDSTLKLGMMVPLTSADGSVVTPGSQCVSDSLTGDTFRSL